MKRVFVCSPYAGNIDQNTLMACVYCRNVIMEGDAPFAPHLLYPQMLDEKKPEDRELGISLGIRMLEACDEIHVFGGKVSSGMRREIDHATKKKIKIVWRFAFLMEEYYAGK